MPAAELGAWLSGRADQWSSAVAELVGLESPSGDGDGIKSCATAVANLASRWFSPREASWEFVGGIPHLRLLTGGVEGRAVLLLCHLDTVWERGAFPGGFQRQGRRAVGPGVFDMKGGVVVGLAALAALAALGGPQPPVRLLCTGDEEVGSATSRALIEEEARRSRAVLVLEPPAGSAVKIGRKGVGTYRLEVRGRAAHAGLEPELGVNAVVELARLVPAVEALADPVAGTTVTPTVFLGGARTNVVPDRAELRVDARFPTAAESARVDRGLRELAPAHPEARVEVTGGPNRPPLEREAAAGLFSLAGGVAAWLGWDELQGVQVGGGSDGNFTAALGVPTLDGLGIVGGRAHAEGEWADLTSIPDRAALLAGCLWALTGEGVGE